LTRQGTERQDRRPVEAEPERFSSEARVGRPRRRIALVSVRFTMFDTQMPADFPARMRAHAARSAELLRKRFDVTECPLIETLDDAAAVAANLAGVPPDAIVFAPAMAAPPSLAAAALSATVAPLVIWNAPAIRHLPNDLGQAEATEHTTTVGSVMYANVRSRAGQPAAVVTAAHDDRAGVERVLRTVAAAAEAGALSGTTVLRLGDPIAGYLDVLASEAELGALGVREVRLEPDAWEREVAGVADVDADALLDEVRRAGWHGDHGPAAMVSARTAVALGRAMDDAGAAAATVNCHGLWFRDSPTVGVTACLGVACQARAGRSISCTGDLPTAIALHLARALAGAALYCECYLPELDTGLALVAAGGEGDPAWAASGAVTLEPNLHYPGRNGPGTSVSFPLERREATLLSLSPAADGWVLAWATGRVVEARYEHFGGPNGMFRFDSGPADESLTRWIASGATHHCALAPGHLDIEVPILAAALGIREVRC
jgi:L-arabinose isomerase